MAKSAAAATSGMAAHDRGAAGWVVLGVANTLPWNAIVTSSLFFQHVFSSRADILMGFVPAITACFLLSNFAAFMTLRAVSVPPRHSIATKSFTLFCSMVFVALILLALRVDAVHGLEADAVFGALLLASIVMGGLGAVYQSAIFAIAATKGPREMQLVVVGFAIAGTLASSAALALSQQKPHWTGLALFSITLAVSVAAARAASERISSDDGDESYLPVFQRDRDDEDGKDEKPAVPRHHLWMCLAAMGLSLLGTMSVFPSLVATFTPVGAPDRTFVPLLFLLKNLGDVLGRASARPLMRCSPAALLLLAVIRTIQLPLFLFAKRQKVEEYWFGDVGVKALVLCNGVVSGAVYTAAAGLAPSTRPQAASSVGRTSALVTGVALALGSVLGGVIVASV